MKLGLHMYDFTWPGGANQLGPTLVKIAQTADTWEFARISVGGHVWQSHYPGVPFRPHYPHLADRHGDGRALLAAGLTGQDGDDPGRAFWGASVAPHWSRGLRRGGTRIGTAISAVANL